MKPFSLNNTEIQKTYGSHWVCSENACTEEKIVYDIEDNYSIICADELYPYDRLTFERNRKRTSTYVI